MKPTNKAIQLLQREFTRDGVKACFSRTHTDFGTMPLWGQLVAAGFVEEIPSVIGHSFNYRITGAGEQYLARQPAQQPK